MKEGLDTEYVFDNKSNRYAAQENLLHIMPKFVMGNMKTGRMFTFNTVYGSSVHHINYRGIKFDCVGTCGECGKACENNGCYVKKSYLMYPNVSYSHAINTIALRSFPELTLETLYNKINRAKNQPKYNRLHSSGELLNAFELNMYSTFANAFPNIRHYTYTKNFGLIIPELLKGNVSEKFSINISIWHEYGINEYNMVKDLPNVHAFVYDDGFDYKAYGLEINRHCPAYDVNGKMNHAFTCDKCGMCQGVGKNRVKVIGCFDH